MAASTRMRRTTLGWWLLLPVTFLGVIPWWLRCASEGPVVWDGTLWQWLGVWIGLNGLGLAGWCVKLFNVQGHGTPLPFDPPKRFVASGPYRFVRNPMGLGFFLVLIGQAVAYRSLVVWWYLLGITGCIHGYVCLIEEPQLRQRFGPAYAAYARQVPRWLPLPPAFFRAPRSRTR